VERLCRKLYYVKPRFRHGVPIQIVPSVNLHVGNNSKTNGFSWNLILGKSTKICRRISVLVKIGQQQRAYFTRRPTGVSVRRGDWVENFHAGFVTMVTLVKGQMSNSGERAGIVPSRRHYQLEEMKTCKLEVACNIQQQYKISWKPVQLFSVYYMAERIVRITADGSTISAERRDRQNFPKKVFFV
jgi:hypothetical protein